MKGVALQTKILVLVVGALIGQSIVGGIVYYKTMLGEKSALVESFVGEAKRLSWGIAAQFYERYGDVQAFAQNEVLKESHFDLAKKTAVLDQYVALYGIYDLILLVNTQGQIVAANSKTFKGNHVKQQKLFNMNLSNQEWFKATVSGSTTDDEENDLRGTFVDKFRFSEVTDTAFGGESYTQVFAAPIKDAKGQIIGVLANFADSRYLEAELKGVYLDLKLKGIHTSEITLIGNDGEILLEYDPTVAGSEAFQRDPKILGQLNLYKLGVPSVVELMKGNSGSLLGIHARKKREVVNGFSVIHGPKWNRNLKWGTLVRAEQTEVFSATTERSNLFYFSQVGLIGLFAIISFFMIRLIARNIELFSQKVKEMVSEIKGATFALVSTSEQLAKSASSEAAAVQETSTSLEEISGMVDSSNRHAEGALDLTKQVAGVVESGEKTMIALEDSMNQIAEANKRVEGLALMMAEIENKTSVIDEIVFQTRLLSFNASVEAERAGEHGRGFAIVAQEVGSLAQLSGKSAGEIGAIVKECLKETQQAIQMNTVCVKEAYEYTKRASQLFANISQNSKQILSGSEQILRASSEQSSGVKQINEAVQSISKVVQENSSSAKVVSQNGRSIMEMNHNLESIAQEMDVLVKGVSVRLKKAA